MEAGSLVVQMYVDQKSTSERNSSPYSLGFIATCKAEFLAARVFRRVRPPMQRRHLQRGHQRLREDVPAPSRAAAAAPAEAQRLLGSAGLNG